MKLFRFHDAHMSGGNKLSVFKGDFVVVGAGIFRSFTEYGHSCNALSVFDFAGMAHHGTELEHRTFAHEDGDAVKRDGFFHGTVAGNGLARPEVVGIAFNVAVNVQADGIIRLLSAVTF